MPRPVAVPCNDLEARDRLRVPAGCPELSDELPLERLRLRRSLDREPLSLRDNTRTSCFTRFDPDSLEFFSSFFLFFGSIEE